MPKTRTKAGKTAPARMTAAEATVAALLAHGIDTIYALPGVQDARRDGPSLIEVPVGPFLRPGSSYICRVYEAYDLLHKDDKPPQLR